MKQKLLLLTFTLISTMLFSQAVPMAFEDWKTTDGTQNFFYKTSSKTDRYGNIFIAGATMNAGTTDILVAKYNSSGNQLWIQQLAGAATGGVDFAAGLAVTDTYVYLTGAISNNTTTAETDCVTMKLATSTGSVVWSSTYDGGTAHDAGKHIVVDGSGNVYITGASYNASYNTDFITLKYNSSGTQQWVSRYDYLGFDDGAIKVVTSGSNLTVTGAVTTATANVYKLGTLTYAQSSGSLIATSVATAVTTSSIDVVTDLTSDASGNLIIIGSTAVSGQANNMYVQKLVGSTLASTWIYTYNGVSNLDDITKAVVTDASGNVYIAGYSTSSTTGKNITLIKLNSSGVNQWTQTTSFAGDDEAIDLVIDASSNLYLTGYKYNSTDGNNNYYTAKYNSSGTLIWEIESDGNQLNDNATNLCLDSLNNVIVTGQIESTPNTYEFMTTKYVQKDVITPTDFNGETPNPNYMYFRNSGQIVDTNFASVSTVKFYSNNTKPSFYFKNYSQSYVFSKIDTVLATVDTIQRIDLSYKGCNETSKIYPLEQQDNGYLNYYMGYLPKQITNVKGNKCLVTPNLYNNIDLMTTSNQNGIKYYYIVKPGGDMRNIQMEFTGATSYSLNGTTNALTINSSIGSITFDKPVAYQLTSANATVAVTSFSPTWATNGAANKYKFTYGAYTASLTLVIEVDQGNAAVTSVTTAPNIEWSTYVGGQSQEIIKDITYGSANNLYVVGQTSSPASMFPQAPGANPFQNFNNGAYDGFVGKFDQTGILQWTTYVGGAGNDVLNSIDIVSNGTGDLYCVGITQSNNLLSKPKASSTLNDNSYNGGEDGMIFQLNQSGTVSNWLTYYGGSGTDRLNKCKFDQLGNLFVVGASNSNNLTVLGSAPQYTFSNSGYDAYVMKLNNSTFDFDWATYVASTGAPNCSGDGFNDLDFNPFNDVFIGGYATGNDYPILHSAGSTTLASTNNCKADGVITQFNNNGKMLWSTYVGSQDVDNVLAVKVDGRDLYVGGYTFDATTFPTHFSGNLYANTTKTVSAVHGGFFVYFDYLNHAEHSTLIGADDGDDQVEDIILDAAHNIYLIGFTGGTNLDQPSGGNPSNTWSENNKGHYDDFIFVIKQGTTDVIWSTLLGGDLTDQALAATIDGNNNLFVAGSAASTTNFPWNDGGGTPVHFQGSLVGGGPNDGSITRFKLSPINFVGINEHHAIADGIFIYPNPTQGVLNIKLSDASQKRNFTIFNAMGQIVTTGSLVNGSTTVNVSNLSDGMYFIEISDKTTKVTAKFIKQ